MQILFFLLAGLLLAVPAAADDTIPAYLAHLRQQARELRLAEQRERYLLLHYRANLFGGYTSEQDDPGFFLSPNGKTDPQAELDATLAEFFSEELVGRSKQPAQCAFVARYTWLKRELSFDDARLRPFKCDRFDAWFAGFDAEAVTLIFPSAYIGCVYQGDGNMDYNCTVKVGWSGTGLGRMTLYLDGIQVGEGFQATESKFYNIVSRRCLPRAYSIRLVDDATLTQITRDFFFDPSANGSLFPGGGCTVP